MDQSAPTYKRTDGRLLRSERTKQILVESYLDLLRENPQIPTAADIAKRAGLSIRSVFERFSDLQSLSFAAADHAFAQGLAQAVARDVDGDRQTRLRSASNGCRCGARCCAISTNRNSWRFASSACAMRSSDGWS